MLAEIKNTRQIEDEGFRRWFTKDSIARRFDRDSKEIDADIAEFVIKRILSFSF